MRSWFSRVLERRGQRRVRRIMRGYRLLKTTGQLGKWLEVRDAITNTPLSVGHTSSLIFGAAAPLDEQVVRQYLLTRVVGPVALNTAILYSLGNGGSPIVHPLPPEWRAVLRQHGFNVASVRAAIAWHGYVALLLGYGILLAGRRLVEGLTAALGPARPALGRHVSFAGLSPAALPQPCADGRSHDIVTWYRRWPGRQRDLDTLCHTVTLAPPCTIDGTAVVAVPSIIPPLTRPASLLRLAGWCAAAMALAAIDLVRGRWWHAVLLGEASAAASVRLQDAVVLARDYLFHTTVSIYRPLWTYEAERKGSQITFYYYSTNSERFKRRDGYAVQGGSWQAMSWPRYLVWDEYQADFVRRAVGDCARIHVVGPIAFHTSATEMPELPDGCVAVFDVQPHRDSRYRILGAPEEYFTPAIATQFLRDIHQVVSEGGGSMALKRKRHAGRLLHPKYARLIAELGVSRHFITVEPDISAQRLIEHAAAVISMPFTSTAILGAAAGKPSIFYDPAGIIEKDDRAAHGIPVVSGLSELRDWCTQLGRRPIMESVNKPHPHMQPS